MKPLRESSRHAPANPWRLPTFSAFGLVAALNSPFACADPNTLQTNGSGGGGVYTDQSGSGGGGLIDIYQVGTGLAGQENQAGTPETAITQAGGGNTVRIGQGAEHDGGGWAETGAVQSNQAAASQDGYSNDAEVYQSGNYNTASVAQSGSGNTALIYQGGDGNSASVSQSGSAANYAYVNQSGPYPSALTATQSGSAANSLYAVQYATGLGVTASIGQNGGGTVNLNQSGSYLSANVSGQTGGTANLTQSSFNDSVAIIGQSAYTVTVSQTTPNQSVTVLHPAMNLRITQ